MILSFSLDSFKERILSGVKIHTIRTDRTERWKKGMKIHFWRGNPRNKNASTKPHEFYQGNCSSVQKIEIFFSEYESSVPQFEKFKSMAVKVDNRLLSPDEVTELAIADGFDGIQDMHKWFETETPNGFKGRLIHWTKKQY